MVARRRNTSLGTALLVLAWGAGGCDADPAVHQPTPVIISVPGFPDQEVPETNPLTEEGIDLGRRLFYDPVLSVDSTLSCGGCHQQPLGFTDGLAVAVGVRDQTGSRSTMGLTNTGWTARSFWDGRAPTLEAQAEAPVPDPIEMDLPWDHALDRLNRHPQYPDLFAAAFGDRMITRDRVVQAVSQFERTLVSNNSRYDRWARGEVLMRPEELRGFLIFNSERGDCFHCHPAPLFTDNVFHNNGLDAAFDDLGLEAISGDPLDRGLFKTPTLRNVTFTAPYMHDGRFPTLEDAVGHYNNGGVFSPTVDPLIRVGGGLGLSAAEIQDLIAFLHALSDTAFVTDPRYSNPFAAP